MRVLKNILIAVGIMIAALIVGAIIDQVNPPHPGGESAGKAIAGFTWLGTSIWAGIASNRLEFRRYKTGLAFHPVGIFSLHFFVWIIAFPWFLTVRDNIKDGSAELKDEFRGSTNAVPQPVPHMATMSPALTAATPTARERISRISTIVGIIIGVGILFKAIIIPGIEMVFPSKESKLLHAVYENIRASTQYPSQVKFHRSEMYVRSDAARKAHRGYLVITEDPGGLHVYEAAAKVRKGEITVYSRKCDPGSVADYDVDPNFCMKNGLPKQHAFYVFGWADDLSDVDPL